MYALELDGSKRPCRVRTSNAGQCLWTGIASDEHARAIAQSLFGGDLFSGWGIRTVGASEARYNPMSYHDGSIWPHDNALIGDGLARYELKEGTLRILESFLEASRFFDIHRLPELFCGFPRRPGAGPTLYPVACAPQSWAAGAIFLLLQSCLGLSIDASKHQVRFIRPALPESIEVVEIKDLQVGRASVDISLTRYPQDVGINVVHREGRVEVVVVK